MKTLLKSLLRYRGYELYGRPWLPRGVDPWETLRNILPDWDPKTIFDIGAFNGDTALGLNSVYPRANIFAFEPVLETHRKLVENTRSHERIHPVKLGISSWNCDLSMSVSGISGLNAVNPNASAAGRETARFSTVDAFCECQAIENISILKSDTEGHELEVLQGARRMFAAKAIDAALIEVGVATNDPRFVPLQSVVEALESSGLALIGLYDQRGWTHRLRLDFADALFLRCDLLP
jgi:FkbM family methyltransferase